MSKKNCPIIRHLNLILSKTILFAREGLVVGLITLLPHDIKLFLKAIMLFINSFKPGISFMGHRQTEYPQM